MQEDYVELEKKLEILREEDAKLDKAIKRAYDALLLEFFNHYPILVEVPMVNLSSQYLKEWIQTHNVAIEP